MERKSTYGVQTTFLWEGCIPLAETVLVPSPSTFSPSRALQQRIAAKRQELLLQSPLAYDSDLWRYEGLQDDQRQLSIKVSPIRYSAHAALKHEQGLLPHAYPNPIGVNTIQETADGYILIGTRAAWTQLGGMLHLIGCGYINRGKGHTLADTVREECQEETRYEGAPPTLENSVTIALIFGENHDTGVTVHVLLHQTRKEIDLNGNEHTDLIFLPNNLGTITSVLSAGTFKGLRCLDQLLGSLEAYLQQKEAGKIVNGYQHR